MSTTSLPRIAAGAALVAALLATGDPVSAGYPGANGRLAFGLNVGGNVDVYSSTPDGNGLRRLTDHPGFEACADYSADGKQIAYCSEETGLFEIWTMTKNGKDRRQLTHLNGRVTFPDFSPDGGHVAFSGRLTLTQPTSDVYAVDANGENRSEEHTSELQSHHDLVCRLLLEKKKKKQKNKSKIKKKNNKKTQCKK